MFDVRDRSFAVENIAKSASVAAFMLVAVIACSQSGGNEAEGRSVCEDPDAQWCYQDPGADGAYHVGHGVLYCYADQVHRQVTEGGITYREFFSESPDWIDERQIDGKPVIVDLPHISARKTGEYSADIISALESVGSPVDFIAHDSCMGQVSQQTLEEAFGGPLEADE